MKTMIQSIRLPAAMVGPLIAMIGAPVWAQTGVESFNGNWIGSQITVEAGEMISIAPADFTVAIDGDSREFEAEWMVAVPDDGAIEWDEQSADFERAERAGYFGTDDDAEFFDGDAVLWAHVGDDGLVLGRLQIDTDTGGHVVFTCRLSRTDAGLDAVIVQSTDGAPAARARITMVRK